MVPWLAFGLLFPLMYAVSNIIDKLLLETRVRNIYSQALIGGACYLVFSAIVVAFHPLKDLPREGVLLALSTGGVLAVSILGYYRSMQVEEITRVVPLLNLSPLFTAMFAYLMIGEGLAPHFYLAIIAMVCGAVLLSVKSLRGMLRLSKAEWTILPTAALWGLMAVLDKVVLGHMSFWNLYALQFLSYGAIIQFLLLSKRNRDAARALVKDGTVLFILVSEIFAFFGYMLEMKSISLTNVSFVSSFGVMIPLYVLVISTLLAVYLPKLHKEPHTLRQIAMKAAATLLIIAGAVVIGLGI